MDQAFLEKGRRTSLIILIFLGIVAFMHVGWNMALDYLAQNTEFPWYGEIYFTGRYYIPLLLIALFAWVFFSVKLDKLKSEQ